MSIEIIRRNKCEHRLTDPICFPLAMVIIRLMDFQRLANVLKKKGWVIMIIMIVFAELVGLFCSDEGVLSPPSAFFCIH